MRIEKTSNKIDLGCGRFKRDGFIGIDKRDYGQEIVWDVRGGIPLQNNSVDEFYSSHTLEHFKEHEILPLLQEIVRVCNNGANVQIIVPHADTKEAYYASHFTRWHELRARGMCADIPNMELISTYIEDIHLYINIKIKK